MPDLSIKIADKKYMWDKKDYLNEEEAKNKKTQYEKDGFEVFISKKEGKFFLYTRKLITEIKIEGGVQ